MNGEALGIPAASHTIGYEDRIFDTSRVHEIAIVMDDWDEFIESCENEEYASCAVVIDGESFMNVAIRAKGNTSLSSVKNMDSQRYSFKLEFDHFENAITYHGLDKLCLNNIIQDNTYMKDYLAYRMMGEFGATAPLCSYVWITVNGEPWGLYLAVEAIEDSFLKRNYGNNTGELYKPDSMSMGGGRGNGRDFDLTGFLESLSDEEEAAEDGESAGEAEAAGQETSENGGAEDGGFPFSDMPEGFDPENFDPSSMEDGGFDFGNMPTPPDFAGEMNASDSSSADDQSDRPMWAWIAENEEYLELYHELYAEFLEKVDVQGIIDEAYELIAPYVEKDPTAFCTYEDFEAAVPVLKEWCSLRLQSIQGQLSGEIPSTTSGQSADDSALIYGSSVNTSLMGSMGGGQGGGPGGGFGGFPGGSEGDTEGNSDGRPGGFGGKGGPGNFGGKGRPGGRSGSKDKK